MRIFSQASQRVLKKAEKQAKLACRSEVVLSDLAVGLFSEESRVTHWVSEQNQNLDEIQLQLKQTTNENEPEKTLKEPNPDEYPPHDSVELEEVFRLAHLMASRLEKDAEIGTDHLLAAVLQKHQPLKDVLLAFHLDISSFSEIALQQNNEAATPLEFHETLDLHSRDITEDAAVWRMIDASANRALEGLRVIEDYIRFQCNDESWFHQLKTLRHELVSILKQISLTSRLTFRDTPSDVGTQVSLHTERTRASLKDVFLANCSRLKESFRSLEEYLKLISVDSANHIERLRYQFYEFEKQVIQRIVSENQIPEIALYLIVSEHSCDHGIGPATKAALRQGASVIQLREKQQTDRRILELGKRVREWTRESGALFIMNDRPDLAALCDADGVHVGQDELPVQEVRKIVGPDRLIGVSTHSLEQAHQAIRDGANYIGVGPVFPSQTKEFRSHVGLELLSHVSENINIPWFAIGGIQADNINNIVQTGCRRIAVSHAICSSKHPDEITAELINKLHQPSDNLETDFTD